MHSTYREGFINLYPGELAERYDLGPKEVWYGNPEENMIKGGIKIGYEGADGRFENPFALAYLSSDRKVVVKIQGGEMTPEFAQGQATQHSKIDPELAIDIQELSEQARSIGRQASKVVRIGRISRVPIDGLAPDVLIDPSKNPLANKLSANRDQSVAVGIVCEPDGKVNFVVSNGNPRNGIQIAFPESAPSGIRTIIGSETRRNETVPDSYCDRFSTIIGGIEFVTNIRDIPGNPRLDNGKRLRLLRKSTEQSSIKPGETYIDRESGTGVVYVDNSASTISRNTNGFNIVGRPVSSRDPKGVGKYEVEVEIDTTAKFPVGSLFFFVPNEATSKSHYGRLGLEVSGEAMDGEDEGIVYRLTMQDAQRLKDRSLKLPFVRGMRLMVPMNKEDQIPVNSDKKLKEVDWVAIGVR